jgi:outer membrane protein assembly factor BamE
MREALDAGRRRRSSIILAMRLPVVAFVALVVPALAGCGFSVVHKIEIQQGNYVTQEMVDQLKPGMTRDQVRFVLGTPLLTDIFHENRWDYVYWRKRSDARTAEQRRISVFFEADKLVRVGGDVAVDGLADKSASN